MKMDWSKEHVLQLVDLVRRRPCLYNIEHESFLNKKERLRAAADLAKILSHSRPGTTVEEVLKKWDELCANFLSKHEHILQSRRGTVARPYYYDKMSFVLDYISPKPSPKLLLERRDDKDVKSNVKCLFEKDTSPGGCSPLGPRRDKTFEEQPPAEPAADGRRCQAPPSLARVVTLGSDEDSCYSYHSQQPALKAPSSVGSVCPQKRAISDALLTHMRDAIASRDASSCSQVLLQGAPEEDEDTLYMKYVLCRLKKLDELQKLKLKFEIDKLFYQVTSPRREFSTAN